MVRHAGFFFALVGQSMGTKLSRFPSFPLSFLPASRFPLSSFPTLPPLPGYRHRTLDVLSPQGETMDVLSFCHTAYRDSDFGIWVWKIGQIMVRSAAFRLGGP